MKSESLPVSRGGARLPAARPPSERRSPRATGNYVWMGYSGKLIAVLPGGAGGLPPPRILGSRGEAPVGRIIAGQSSGAGGVPGDCPIMRDIHQLIGPKRKVSYADEGLGETLVAEMWMAREWWWIRIKE